MRQRRFLIACLLLFAHASQAVAGMPSPLPTNYQERFLQLNDSALHRLQIISFFLCTFLLCAGAVKLLWNGLRRDLPALPRLSYLSALTCVFLWSLLFVIVLTMISGARELMTPGAWKQQGFTYKLAQEQSSIEQTSSESIRRLHLEKLRLALWEFAATHEGHFPSLAKVSAISSDLWEVPGSGAMHYLYVPDQTAGHSSEVLAYEPELDPDQRLVLQTNGDIVVTCSAEIQAELTKRKKP